MEDFKKHRHIEVMARYAGESLANGEIDFEAFVKRLFSAVGDMIFRKFESTLPEAMRTYCHIALVDPMLVEAYLGIKFDDIDFQPLIDAVEGRTISKNI